MASEYASFRKWMLVPTARSVAFERLLGPMDSRDDVAFRRAAALVPHDENQTRVLLAQLLEVPAEMEPIAHTKDLVRQEHRLRGPRREDVSTADVQCCVEGRATDREHGADLVLVDLEHVDLEPPATNFAFEDLVDTLTSPRADVLRRCLDASFDAAVVLVPHLLHRLALPAVAAEHVLAELHDEVHAAH